MPVPRVLTAQSFPPRSNKLALAQLIKEGTDKDTANRAYAALTK